MIALLLTANTLLYTLRLTTPVGSFPKPLSAKEEQYYLAVGGGRFGGTKIFWWSGT